MNAKKLFSPIVAVPAAITVFILLIPFIAMFFTTEVNWTLSDYFVASTLLFGTGLSYMILSRKSSKILYKIAVGFALFSGLFLIWVNLAVGIIGSEKNAINLLYYGVIAVGILGSIIARFQSKGMAVALWGMAAGQALIAATALVLGMDKLTGSSFIEIIGVNGFFTFMFVTGGLLFRFIDKKEE